jgi:plasmid stabilization system protein ParE
MVTQVVSALQRLAAMPEMYGKVWEDIRAFPVRKTRYVVYYRAFPGRVEVLATMQGDRDPSAWQGRA